MRLGFWFLFWVSLRAFAEPNYLSFPSDIPWKTIRSEHFQILYRSGQNSFANRTLQAAERAHRLLSPIFPEAPPSTFIVLADFSDSLNGYSLNFPYPHFVVFAAPPDSSSELAHLDQWLESVVLHEYAHTLHLYPAQGAWKWMRAIFGTWVVPNGMMPQHFHEGLATFLETQFSKGGRGRGSAFSMFTRKAVESGDWGTRFAPLDLFDGAPSVWPLGTSPYYFGFYFYEALWKKKGAQGIHDLTSISSKNWPYLISGPIEEVYGVSPSQLWTNIFQEKKEIYEKELQHLKSSELSELHYWSNTYFTKKQLILSPQKDRLAFLSQSPEKGSLLEIVEVQNGSSLAQHPMPASGAGGICWKKEKTEDLFLIPISRRENSYTKNLIRLFSSFRGEVSFLKTKEGNLEHVHYFDCSDGEGLLGVYQEVAGEGSLRIFQGAWGEKDAVMEIEAQWALPSGSWISSLAVGKTTFFLLRTGTETFFYRWELRNKPEVLGVIEGHSFEVKKQPDGTLHLVSSLSGRDEIWEWLPEKRKLKKVIAVTGGILSFVPQKESFLVASYRTGGFDIARAQPINRTETRDLMAVSENQTLKNPKTNQAAEEDYSPLSTLLPRTWIPSALIVPYGIQASAWIPMFDLSQKHFYDVQLGVDQRQTNEGNQRLPYLSTLYGYRFGKASLIQSSAYFLPGFLTISRAFFKRWGSSLSYSAPLFSLPIQSRLSAIFRKIESSTLGPANQSIGLGLELGWASQGRGNSLDANISQGIRITASHQQFLKALGSQDGFFSSLLNFEGTLQSPFWSNALWYLSLRQGYTEGTPLYNSFFEGGGELMFSQGRGFFLNRGYLQGSFAARRIFGGNLEFRFPISQIERGINLWPAFLNQVSGALVLDTTSFDYGPSSKAPRNWMKEFLWSTGVELKTQWQFFYYLPTQVRWGAYRGLSRGGEPFYFTMGVETALQF